MNHSFCVGRERRNPDGGQVAIPDGGQVAIPEGGKWQFPRGQPVFFLLAASFLCSTLGFHPGSPSEIVPTPYIYRDELPISLTYFWL